MEEFEKFSNGFPMTFFRESCQTLFRQAQHKPHFEKLNARCMLLLRETVIVVRDGGRNRMRMRRREGKGLEFA